MTTNNAPGLYLDSGEFIPASELAAGSPLAAGQATAAPAQPGRVSLSANAAHEIQGMLEEAAALIGSMPAAIFEQLRVRHFQQDELRGGAGIVRDAMASAPAQPAAEASRFGSPELQAMIIARCVEKDQADSVQEDALDAEVLRDAERYRFIRDVPYSDDVRSVLVHQQNAAMDRVIDAALAAIKKAATQ